MMSNRCDKFYNRISIDDFPDDFRTREEIVSDSDEDIFFR